MNTDQHMLITGEPGTGKSHLGGLIIECYRKIGKDLHITSTTAKSCKNLD